MDADAVLPVLQPCGDVLEELSVEFFLKADETKFVDDGQGARFLPAFTNLRRLGLLLAFRGRVRTGLPGALATILQETPPTFRHKLERIDLTELHESADAFKQWEELLAHLPSLKLISSVTFAQKLAKRFCDTAKSSGVGVIKREACC